jgi:hypothetical protein
MMTMVGLPMRERLVCREVRWQETDDDDAQAVHHRRAG